MTDPIILIDHMQREMRRHITTLGRTSVRLSLMSVAARCLPPALLKAAVRSAAAPSDMVAALGDGSVCVLSFGQPSREDENSPRFLYRLEGVLARVASRRDVGLVRFRAVHRWACEVIDPSDLFDSLHDSPPLLVQVPPLPLDGPTPMLRRAPPLPAEPEAWRRMARH